MGEQLAGKQLQQAKNVIFRYNSGSRSSTTTSNRSSSSIGRGLMNSVAAPAAATAAGA
jgi:hypothetical protein